MNKACIKCKNINEGPTYHCHFGYQITPALITKEYPTHYLTTTKYKIIGNQSIIYCDSCQSSHLIIFYFIPSIFEILFFLLLLFLFLGIWGLHFLVIPSDLFLYIFAAQLPFCFISIYIGYLNEKLESKNYDSEAGMFLIFSLILQGASDLFTPISLVLPIFYLVCLFWMIRDFFFALKAFRSQFPVMGKIVAKRYKKLLKKQYGKKILVWSNNEYNELVPQRDS